MIEIIAALALIDRLKKEKALKDEQAKRDANIKTEDAEFEDINHEVIEPKQLTNKSEIK